MEVLKGGLDQGERIAGGGICCAAGCTDLCEHYVVQAKDREGAREVEDDHGCFFAAKGNIFVVLGQQHEGCKVVEELSLAGACCCASELEDRWSGLR